MDTVGMFLLMGFIGVMLLLPFGIMLGAVLPGRRRTAVSENRQPPSAAGGSMEA